MPSNEIKKKAGDLLFEIVSEAGKVEGYEYNEPSDYSSIIALRDGYKPTAKLSEGKADYDKIYGAWMGRICGCMLGKSVEGMRTDELVPFLKETNNYPMHRYIYRSDLPEDVGERYKYPLQSRGGCRRNRQNAL